MTWPEVRLIKNVQNVTQIVFFFYHLLSKDDCQLVGSVLSTSSRLIFHPKNLLTVQGVVQIHVKCTLFIINSGPSNFYLTKANRRDSQRRWLMMLYFKQLTLNIYRWRFILFRIIFSFYQPTYILCHFVKNSKQSFVW